MNETAIIQQSLAGNPDAFAQLVNRYQCNVIALAMNITGDADDARDVAQDSFMQAFTNLHRFDRNRTFKKWLMGITVKRSIDRVRKNKSFLKFFKRYMRVAKTEDTLNTKMIEDSLIIHPLLKKLNGKERSILSLYINESYSAKEIGTMLNCSENTIRVHLFNARKKLKKELLNNPVPGGNYEVVK
ncbi:MAG: sigma-70 family RNA polymerase sigma factor [Candidatus Aminicenantes bacterium]|nr:sigma-70 family RNA polymerase sigma factor [Candidatus Aminicenantes bacterium]